MTTISLCMIAKNDEVNLSRCIDSVIRCIDELIIVDTGSTDRTKELSAHYTNCLFDYVWSDDFSAARNFSFSKASCDYILWLNADDILPAQSADALIALKKELSSQSEKQPDVIMLPYQIAFDSEDNCTMWYYRERLIRRSAGLQWIGAVHEYIPISCNVLYKSIPIACNSIDFKNHRQILAIYRKMIRNGFALSPRDTYYYGRELWTHGQFRGAAKQFRQFLKMESGWKCDRIEAYRLLADCYAHQRKPALQKIALMRGLEVDGPQASLCRELGDLARKQEQWQLAVFWYQSALRCKKNLSGLINEDEYSYLPDLGLSICYDQLGECVRANFYNECALRCKPHDPTAVHNAHYLKSRLYSGGKNVP